MSDNYEFEEEEFTTQFNGGTFRRILAQVQPHWRWVVGFLAAVAVTSILDAYFTFLSKRIVDDGIVAGDRVILTRTLITYGSLIIVQALSVLAARIRDAQEREHHAKIASERKSLVGSGDRSERIRTYNFPQGRVTDHRINLTLYKIDSIMDGDLEELINALSTEHQTELLAALADGE